MNYKKWRKTALALSAFLFVLWWALGTGATLAWFSDVDIERNEFKIGLLDMEVSYKNDLITKYTPLNSSTPVFNDTALYEPGYTQVVYLKIDNTGTVAFDYKVALTAKDTVLGEDKWKQEFYLSHYLRYGIVLADTEEALQEMLKDRLSARNQANNVWNPMGTWAKKSTVPTNPHDSLEPENACYAALIVYMPEGIGNVANHRGNSAPQVEIGIKIFAQQAGAPLD